MNQLHTTAHSRDPLHGITLETIGRPLVARHGWAKLGARVPIRCYRHHPTIQSSLTFLRKTPWARKRVEHLFVAELH
ncbi:MAG: VF530 family DNA-binding protein [Nitrospira sp.]